MSITTLTSREFNQDTARAKKAAAKGPVVITDRGMPSHVLLSYDRYLALSGGEHDIVALLGMAEAAGIDFDPPKAGLAAKAAKLS
ncbi:MAG: type II toxin-antitoxin system Phd/YefM family antitoxin [Rubrivivax sp.]